jgi:hypothetical protein
MKKLSVLCLGLLLCVGALQPSVAAQRVHPARHPAHKPHAVPHHSARAHQKDAIRAAVFRYLLYRYGPQWPRAKTYFFNVGTPGRPCDPSPALMTWFRHEALPVKKASQSDGRAFAVREKGTGAPGLLLTVSSLKWITDTQVEVEGGYRAHRRAGNTAQFQVARQGDRWVVTEETVKMQYRADPGGLTRDAHLSTLHPSGL